jgi:hypothetical protein
MKKLIVCVAAIASVAVVATALAGSSDYGGKIEKGGRIGIDTDGGQDHVDRIRYEKFPATCNGNPNFFIKATWIPASDVPIVDKEFATHLQSMKGDRLDMTGKLRHGGDKIVGDIKAKQIFDGGATTCTTKKRDYTAKLGRDTTNGDPKASYRRDR